jgi:hypothetical protein
MVAVFSRWVERVRWVLENNGDYYHEQIHFLGKYFLIRLPDPWRYYILTPCKNGKATRWERPRNEVQQDLEQFSDVWKSEGSSTG